MKTTLALLGFVATVFGSVTTHADVKSFDKGIGNYQHPQLLDNNDTAFEARLFLLDSAPAGATAKIATFVFEHGTRTQQLSVHLCKAAKRGVKVELLVDSKSGDRVDMEDAFDSTPEIKKNEETYAFLANCGVKVYIHNSVAPYVTFFGKKLPNFFGVKNGSSVGIKTLLSTVDNIKDRLTDDILQPLFQKLGMTAKAKDLIGDIKSLALNILHFTGIAGFEDQSETASDPIEGIRKRYKNLVQSDVWKQLDAEKGKEVVKTVKDAMLNDKGNGEVSLRDFYATLRMYNRLNHRKLFVVETEDKHSGCAIIGGRNLGDHYLATSKDSFHDGDVLVCRHHITDKENEKSDLFASIDASFNDLRDNTVDPEIGDLGPSPVRLVEANPKYKNLLSDNVADQGFVEGIALENFSEPTLLTTGWDPLKDQVRFAMLRGIVREQNEVYIETAYAELNGSVRRALDDALARGVKVYLITNGFFISDGPSKLIRLWMRNWIEKNQKKYPKLFTVGYATLDARHMIHFKGAGFRCQKAKEKNQATGEMEDKYYRTYLIGSHNFHPRSGTSDKEHMLQWNEATTESCKTETPPADLVALRKGYYAKLNKTGVPHIMGFTTLYTECTTAISYANKFPKDKELQKLADYARAIKRVMYISMGTAKVPELLYVEETDKLFKATDESGIRDLLGLFL